MSIYAKREQEIINKIQSMGCGFTRRDMFGRYCKKIDAYLKITNQPLSKESEYFEKYTEEEFDELLRKHYDIKEKDITYKGILKAKPKKEQRELTEYEEQKLFVKWLRDNKIKCQSSGNGFKLDTSDNVRYMAKLKASGLSTGFPDLEVLIGNGKTIYVEMKKKKGGTISEAQIKWIEWMNKNNYPAKVCYGAEDAIYWVRSELEKIKNT